MLEGQENKMSTQIAISPGTQVKHERYGIGTVVKEWGSWLCCKVCLTPFEDEKRSRKCSVCKYEGESFQVNSRGIFDVRFVEHGNAKCQRLRINGLKWLRCTLVIAVAFPFSRVVIIC